MRIWALVAWLCFSATVARAEEPEPLKYDLRVDVPLTAVGLTITALPLFLGGPDLCRLCGVNRFDAAARRAFLWKDHPGAAYTTSNVLAFSVPAAAAALLGGTAWRSGDAKTFGVDALIVTEAVSVSLALNQLIKLAAARERPFVHYRNQRVLDEKPRAGEDNVSFYSMHTSFAFSIVAATATVARLRGYDSAPYVWGIGMPLAALTGFMRIAADRHYLTDVLTGALLSTALGIALPRLMHGRKNESVPAVGIAPRGPTMTLSWAR